MMDNFFTYVWSVEKRYGFLLFARATYELIHINFQDCEVCLYSQYKLENIIVCFLHPVEKFVAERKPDRWNEFHLSPGDLKKTAPHEASHLLLSL